MKGVRFADGRLTIGDVEFDIRLTALIIYCTVVPMIDFYGHSPTGVKAWDRFIFYFIGSVLFIRIVYRQPLSDFGFQWGDWRRGILYTLISCAAMGVVLWFVARTPAMASYYKVDSLARATFLNGVELFAWEFIWRGLALFAFARVFGPGPAIFLQAVPFAFMHLNKPEIEALSTIFGGAAFGFIAWRTRSFVWPFLIHWFIATFTMLVASGVI